PAAGQAARLAARTMEGSETRRRRRVTGRRLGRALVLVLAALGTMALAFAAYRVSWPRWPVPPERPVSMKALSELRLVQTFTHLPLFDRLCQLTYPPDGSARLFV